MFWGTFVSVEVAVRRSSAGRGGRRRTTLAQLARGLLAHGRLPCRVVKVRELIKLLESDGWGQVRMRGSHRQFQHPAKAGTVTVAGKLGVDVPPGTLANVLRQADLKQPGRRS